MHIAFYFFEDWGWAAAYSGLFIIFLISAK